MTEHQKSLTTSKTTMIASFACAIHCLSTPFLVMLLPVLGPVIENEFVEYGMLGLSLVLGLIIIYSGFCKHRRARVLFLFLLGAIAWSLNLAAEHMGLELYGLLLLGAGSLFVIASYVLNHRFLKCHTSCDHPH